ncbi:YabP/YqfC family sporulation protein [Ferroacidibacillus organovorans]|uniref:Sporulation protein YqfC n=1 Tax=Ferroacidibacillus organovorans TaxID=1765683 RepID=A0A162TR03_9BACL|nr:YabP/YqfC family sporulation protein [Ferroacidibacillus organovorans]KYP81042.1 hypothetical protein AYJ22_08910 [Ferroacidibacillus organovorans]OAG93706.1 hypothetical protein AYW79_09370 [Ferroacidibacillus organovorans]OPG17474.1 hypothetical protein B2M26_01725 [Ferroacidibacillus organovorans]
MRRTWRERTERFAGDVLQIPKDTLSRLPRVTLIKDMQAVVENYTGIRSYGSQEICIAFVDQELVLQGEGMEIRSIYPEEIVIEGRILATAWRN